MLVTKTRAAELAGVSRRTFYNHIPQKKISVTVDDEGTEKVDVSELERVYGKEIVSRNLKDLSDQEEGGVHEREASRASAQGRESIEVRLLRERIKALEESKEQLETFTRREREQYSEEIENLREGLKKAQDHSAQLSLLLTDQRSEEKSIDSEQEKRMAEMEKTISEMRKLNVRVLKALDEERKKGFWQKLFG